MLQKSKNSFSIRGLTLCSLRDYDLAALAKAIDDDAVRACLTYYNKSTVLDHLQTQARRLRRKDEWCFVVEDQKPLGFAGILAYKDGYETITYLSPLARRTGINTICKHIQFQMGIYTKKPIYAGVKEWNQQSYDSMKKHWPVEPLTVDHALANGDVYRSFQWKIQKPPAIGMPLSSEEKQELLAFMRQTKGKGFKI